MHVRDMQAGNLNEKTGRHAGPDTGPEAFPCALAVPRRLAGQAMHGFMPSLSAGRRIW
jgi:hypothetical protein